MKVCGILIVLVLSLARPAAAHRLDEYLQSAKISVERNRIGVEIHLTPGAAVADDVVSTMDRDRNGTVSPQEAGVYAEAVLKSVSLEIDGESRRLHLDSQTFPSVEDMRHGDGIIRLKASAMAPTLTGNHRLKFVNTHRPDIGVYLVNALVPEDDRVGIHAQSRDPLQREFELDYTIVEPAGRLRAAALFLPAFLGLAGLGVVIVVARR